MKKIFTINAGISIPSTSEKLISKITDCLGSKATNKGEGLEFQNLSLKEIGYDLINYLETGGINTPRLESIKNDLTKSDGLVAVTPIFSSSYTGLFKLFFDTLNPDAINGMPVIIGATAGTSRHSLALDYSIRPLLNYFRTKIIPTGIFASTNDFGGTDEHSHDNDSLQERISRASSEFIDALFIEKSQVAGFSSNIDNFNKKLTRKSGTTISEETIPDFKNLLKDYL